MIVLLNPLTRKCIDGILFGINQDVIYDRKNSHYVFLNDGENKFYGFSTLEKMIGFLDQVNPNGKTNAENMESQKSYKNICDSICWLIRHDYIDSDIFYHSKITICKNCQMTKKGKDFIAGRRKTLTEILVIESHMFSKNYGLTIMSVTVAIIATIHGCQSSDKITTVNNITNSVPNITITNLVRPDIHIGY